MNILIVSPIASHPPISGARNRINKLVSYLKELGHKITFLHYNMEYVGKKAESEMRRAWDRYIQVPKTKDFQKSCGHVYGIDDWYEDPITNIILHEYKNNSFDVVITNYVFMTKFFEKLPKEILKIVDTHDILSDRLELYRQNSIEPGFYYTTIEEEKVGLDRADIVFAIQDIEAEYFQQCTKARVITINHLEDKRFLNKKYNTVKKIGYIGANNKFNIKSIEEFIKEFQKYKNLNVELYIAGNICNALKVNDPRIKLLGFAASLSQFYEKMDLIINPTIIGTGLKIKSIEALSFGVPVISTKIGFEGIDSKLKEHNLRNAKELIDCIDNIYKNQDKLNFIVEYSKELFEKYLEKNQFKLFQLFPPSGLTTKKNLYYREEEIFFEPLFASLDKLSSISFLKSPIVKFKAYKNVLDEYHKIK